MSWLWKLPNSLTHTHDYLVHNTALIPTETIMAAIAYASPTPRSDDVIAYASPTSRPDVVFVSDVDTSGAVGLSAHSKMIGKLFCLQQARAHIFSGLNF